MSTPNYRMKQSELYSICRFILDALATPDLLTRFANFKGKYTTTWLTDRNTEIDAAEDTPDEQNRNAIHESKRIELLALNQNVLHTFNSLERYIAEVIQPEQQKPAFEAAGANYYSAAADADFESTIALLNTMVNYITINETILLNSGLNMPASFLANVQALQTNFNNLHNQFLAGQSGAETIAQEKILLNNNLYINIIRSVNADAQAIFIRDSESSLRKQFTLDHQLYLVRGAGVAGIRFSVTDSTTNLPIPQATVSIPTRSYTALTNDQGRHIKLQLAAGNYTIEAAKTGYTPYTATVEIQTGTVKRVNIALTPL